MKLVPSIIVAALIPLSGCGDFDSLPLSLFPPAVVNAPVQVAIERGRSYGQAGGETLLYDFYRPDASNGIRPLVVVIHGGSWRNGSREDMGSFAYDLAAHGYAAASIDYRLITGRTNVYPIPIADVLTAVRFFRDQTAELNIDPDRVALLGLSAGGHLALMAGMAADDSIFDAARPTGESLNVRAIVDLFGPTDFTGDPNAVTPTQLGRVANFLGASPENISSALRAEASPITYARGDGPPVLVIHGDADTVVPVSQARILVGALNAAGELHEYHEIAGMDHLPGAVWPGQFVQEYRPYIFAFLSAHL